MANVIQTIAAVKRDLGAVAKEKRMEAGPAKYNYRTIDDVLNKLHDPLINHGLVIVPQLRRVEQTSAGETRSGTKQTRTVVEFEWLICGPEGDTLTAATTGEAIDSGDKGTNKGGTSAFKQLLGQLFAIPFETNDPDDSHVEVKAPSPVKEDRKPASSPKEAPTSASGGKSSAEGATLSPSAGSATERKCATCTYAIGPKDAVKKRSGAFHHASCLDGEKKAPVTEDDISSIIDAFPGATEE